MRPLLVLALVPALAVGCGGRAMKDLRVQAAVDLSCPEEQLEVHRQKKVGEVSGCGRSARYHQQKGRWIRDDGAQTTSAGAPPPAAPATAGATTHALTTPVTGPVKVNGKELSAQEVDQAAAYFGQRPAPGDWWYDAKAGLFGAVGHGTQGVLRAGFQAPPLQRAASYGISGVLVNGRELTKRERDYLITIFKGDLSNPDKYAGAYDLDAQGNLSQGGRVLGNVAAAAKSAQQGSGGTWHSKGGAMGGSAPGCSWVYIPNATTGSSTSVMSGCD